MSEVFETMKCNNPNSSISMCRECQRNGMSKDNEYETFNLNKPIVGWQCDGYISKRETKGLFDE